MSSIKVLGIYYTSSNVHPALAKASIDSVEKMIANTPGGKVVYSVWNKIPYISEDRQQVTYFRHNGHLNIALQIYRALLTNTEYDLVAFLEHDVLYHENYLNNLANSIRPNHEGVSYRSFCGMNAKGYQKLIQQDEPMSMLSLRYDRAIQLMQEKISYYAIHGHGCIEPDNKRGLLSLQGVDNVHVNMNETTHSHHLTSHYNCYSKTNVFNPHPYWGDYKNFHIFD